MFKIIDRLTGEMIEVEKELQAELIVERRMAAHRSRFDYGRRTKCVHEPEKVKLIKNEKEWIIEREN